MGQKIEILNGKPDILGAHFHDDGVNFAIYSKNASKIEICIFDKNDNETHKIDLKYKTNDVFHAFVKNIGIGTKYGIRAYGEYAPENGNWFDESKLLFDPFAKSIDRPFELSDEMLEYGVDSAKKMPKAIVCEPKVANPKSNLKLKDLIIYELHIKGFTKSQKDIPIELRGRFKGLCAKPSIEYLKALGINAVEILPANAWIDENHLRKLGLKNYWGYNTIGFLTPDPKLAPDGWDEVRECVETLEQNGIETIIDVVFNHSGEGDKYGPNISLRGLDNKTYYMRDENGEYSNFAGCGNVLNCNEDAVIKLILDSLRAWRLYGGVHGFRFDLASVLGRDENGFNARAIIFELIENDPILKKCKLIAEPWDCAGYNLSQFPQKWAEWNDKFRDCMRKFWLKNEIGFGEFVSRFCGSQDLFGNKSPDKSINYIIAHDGFTLNDLVLYNHKHNDANGEQNRDGSNDNHSYNHGIEGQTQDIAIIANRKKTMRNLLTSLILARGTPMITMGSEIWHSQNGNNNSYAQDNEINYIDWENIDFGLLEFTKKLIEIRKKYGCFASDTFFNGQPNPIFKDIIFQNQYGQILNDWEWNSPDCECIKIQINQNDDAFCLIINRGNNDLNVNLPSCKSNQSWHVEIDTANLNNGEILSDGINISSKSLLLLRQAKATNPKINPIDEATLDKLCNLYKIDNSWWDLTGKETKVSQVSKKAILSAMGIDCETYEDALRAIYEFTQKQLRPLPHIASFDIGDEIKIMHIGTKPNTSNLLINGQAIEFDICAQKEIILANETRAFSYEIKLKSLEIGIYEIAFENDIETKCRLIIAPQKAYLPEVLETKDVFGYSVQSYSLKRENDQGIGDFSSVKQCLEHCQNTGASILAINPLHALFGAQRDLKSPYYPSDRRFIDPIYIDVSKFAPDFDFTHEQKSPNVLYKEIWAKKRDILQKSFAQNRVTKAFNDFCNNGAQSLDDYAVFESIDNIYNANWPDDLKQKSPSVVKEFKQKYSDEIEFQKYLQFIANGQLSEICDIKLPIGLNLDLAIGAAPMGAENWCNSHLIAGNISIGAPPDPLGPQGQVWGLPPYIPHKIIEDKLCKLEEIFNANMRFAGALRIDHAMGLMRLFWVPNGMNGADGTYVNYPFAHILRLLKLLSHKNQCLIIGEDLGTVPFGFSENMQSQNIFSYKVLPFERENNSFKKPKDYPQNSFTCAFTHDLPPLAGWWDGIDINERDNLGIFNKDDASNARLERNQEIQSLINALKINNLLDENHKSATLNDEIIIAIHKYIAISNAKIAIIQIEDLAREATSVNLPGTDKERPNWQRKISKNIDQIFGDENNLSTKIANAMKLTNR